MLISNFFPKSLTSSTLLFCMPAFPLLRSDMKECQENEKLVKVQWCLKLAVPRLIVDGEQDTAAA